MKVITNINEANILLKNFVGANTQIFSFDISHKKLIIRLTKEHLVEVLYIAVVSCEQITCSFSWKNMNMSIVSFKDKETKETMTKIFDEESGFELVSSGGFSLAMGIESEFLKQQERFIP